MYKQKILNDFYEELFSTDFNDYASPVQNLKTDLLVQTNCKISFDAWLDKLGNRFCFDSIYNAYDLQKAIDRNKQFVEDMKREYDYLVEETQELIDELKDED